MLQMVECRNEARHIARGETVLAALLASIYLKEDFCDPILLSCFLLECFEKAKAVHGVNPVHQRQGAFHLVALQMADEVPNDGRGQLESFAPQFLWPVFSQVDHAQL